MAGWRRRPAGCSMPPITPTSRAASQLPTSMPCQTRATSPTLPWSATCRLARWANWATSTRATKINGTNNYYLNPNVLGANVLTNYSNSSYNGLQMEMSRRFSKGLPLQANYTWSKVLSDSQGNQQTDFEPFLDINNAKIERSRTQASDLRQVFKANFNYDLPFGEGHKLNERHMNRVLSGWKTAGIFTAQSGTPFSILSVRGTLNRAARSTYNTVNTML